MNLVMMPMRMMMPVRRRSRPRSFRFEHEIGRVDDAVDFELDPGAVNPFLRQLRM